ncbi:hypothetical protein ACFQ06_09700 [Tessaracoccus lubricantis]|uniref:hypothetical protein n=1 Tax=Tessaracoccus lubricantis TaxID=545543 RepID=UPI0031F18658
MDLVLFTVMGLFGILLSQLDSFGLDVGWSLLVFSHLVLSVSPRNPVHMMFLVGLSTFIYFPAIANSYVYDTGFELFYLSAFVGIFFLYWTRGLLHEQQVQPVQGAFVLFFWMSVGIMVASFVRPELVAGVFAIYSMLFAMSLGSRSWAGNVRALIIFASVFTTYALLGWGGFGRTVLVGWLLVVLLYYTYASGRLPSRLLFAFLPPLGVFFLASRDLFSVEYAGLDVVLNDSAFGPYRLASGFVAHSVENGVDFSGFWDQVVFVLFVYVPRDWWPSKPYGFGFEYTVENLGQGLVEAGHSVAATFIGEHLYYLGHWGILSGLAMALAVAVFMRFVHGLKGLHGNGLVVIAASVPVLVWGGMSSFAARIALPVILLFGVLAVARFLSTRTVGEVRQQL